MIAEAGHYALVLALALALVQSVVPLIGVRLAEPTLMGVAGSTAVAQFAFAMFAFGALTIAYVVSDFSVVNVFENSHSAKPLLYKITGVWGNHEGSMLLWVLILALFSALVAIFGNNLPSVLRALVLAVQGWIAGSCVSPIRRSRGGTSTRYCRTSVSRCIRRCFTSVTSASRSRSRLRSQR
jgi:cytochrome c-type biogenesis protein CcmF